MGCMVSFTNDVCVIQDQHSGNLIGTGERSGGLYFYRHSSRINATISSGEDDFGLWHRFMGHLADRMIKFLSSIKNSTYGKYLYKACQVFPQAKQSRSRFPVSNSSRIYELIHCDLWWPYIIPFSCNVHYFFTFVDDFLMVFGFIC